MDQLGLSGEAGPLGVMGQRIPYRGWGKQRILQVRLQQYRNWELQMFKLDLEKAEAPEIKLPTSVGSLKKQESSRKISALLTTPKPLTVWLTTNCGTFLNRWEYQTALPASWEIYIQIKKLRTGHGRTDQCQTGKEFIKAVYCHPAYFT